MKRKKIFLVGPPFSGHLYPLLGIGRRLSTVADITVLSTPSGVKAAANAGLVGHEIMAAHERTIWEIAEPGSGVKSNPLLLYRQLKANVAIMGELKDELTALFKTERPDLVIADFTVPVAGLAASELGIPWWTTIPSPCVFETPDGPPAYCGGQSPTSTLGRRLIHAVQRSVTRLFKRMMWLLFRAQFRAIGFKGIYREDGSEAVYSPTHIFGLSMPEIEFPRTYPPQFKIIGPVLYSPPVESPAPDFSDAKAKHVLITIGTHLPHAKGPLVETMREIAHRHPQIVFHFSHGKASSPRHEQIGNFHEYPFIAYNDYLPRYDLVVHHGGCGILNHCLHHGKPAVVFPHDYDQFDFAARLVHAGLALRANRPEELESLILKALEHQELRDRCQATSTIHQEYDAEGHVLKLVEAM